MARKKKTETGTALVVQDRALVLVENQPELIDITLDRQLKVTLEEVKNLEAKIDGTERTIGFCLHSLSFRYPEIAMRLREKLNKFRELQGMAPMPDEIDPLSQKNAEGTSEEEERAKLDAEAEEAARKAIAELDDKDLSPGQRRAKFIERKRREKCKRLYLKIAKMTHPDKVKDPELNNVFHQGKKAYDALDLDQLERMHKDVKDYTSIRGHRGKFRDFKLRRLKHSEGLKNAAQTSLTRLEKGLAFKCAKTYETGSEPQIRLSYHEFIDEQCFRVQNAIEDIRAQMRTQSSRFDV